MHFTVALIIFFNTENMIGQNISINVSVDTNGSTFFLYL